MSQEEEQSDQGQQFAIPFESFERHCFTESQSVKKAILGYLEGDNSN